MLDNFFSVCFHRLDKQSLNALADFLEAQASMLRSRAKTKEAEENGSRSRIKEINMAGRDAVDYYLMGVSKELAIQMASTENSVPYINVESNMKYQLQAEETATRKKQIETIFMLSAKGKPIREIAQIVGLSFTRVSQIRREKKDAVQMLRKKNKSMGEIAKQLNLTLPCVSEIINQS